LERKILKVKATNIPPQKKKGNHIYSLQRETALSKYRCIFTLISKQDAPKKRGLEIRMDESCGILP